MDDGLGRVSGSLRGLDLDGDRPGRPGARVEPEVCVGDHTKRPEGPCKELREVVASDVLDYLAAGLRNRPVREDNGDPDDLISYGPVTVATWPRGVRRDDAPYGRPGSRLRRVDSEHLIGAGKLLLKVLQL